MFCLCLVRQSGPPLERHFTRYVLSVFSKAVWPPLEGHFTRYVLSVFSQAVWPPLEGHFTRYVLSVFSKAVWPSSGRPLYTLHPVCLSISLSIGLSHATVSSKMENHTAFIFRREVMSGVTGRAILRSADQRSRSLRQKKDGCISSQPSRPHLVVKSCKSAFSGLKLLVED